MKEKKNEPANVKQFITFEFVLLLTPMYYCENRSKKKLPKIVYR